MSNEIKEISDKIKKCLIAGYDVDIITQDELNILWNYITNLQDQVNALVNVKDKLLEENERLKEENKRIFSKVNDDELLISNAMNYAEAQDYKSRVEKAIEYIKEEFGCTGVCVSGSDLPYSYIEDLLNILQGGKDE